MSNAPSFRLDTGAAATLGVSGVLGFDNAAAAWQAIRTTLAVGRATQLDLSGVSHCDSAGLACVLAAVADSGRYGQTVLVTGMPAGMRALARVCEVDGLLS